ncbi:MAG: histidine kinase [Chitinophaga sp.]|uniref:sensor histidine kinase n=1 Tax=Chitinophaga sp. TaxID=1869181 RepID=UPI001B0BD787|nr:histidine kinase [Chitinophaga sp.]MBO9727381.1 histidine kinase [Chitinophaga sp.]
MKVYRHLTFICLLLVVVLTGNSDMRQGMEIYLKVTVFILLMLPPYINLYILVPKLLFTRKYLQYLGAVILIIASFYCLIVFVLRPYFEQFSSAPKENEPTPMDILSFSIIFGIFIAATTAIKLFQRWIIDSQRIHQLENIRLNTELQELKSQINPHFMFNMLNNAHVLTQRDPVKASQILLRLSNLLRYQLYDSNREQVLLSADIRFLRDFLDLEKIRRDFFEFTITDDTGNDQVLMPPFLFIPFVENAVKHSVDPLEKSYVHLKFNRQQDKLIFECINSKPAVIPPAETYGRLGLTNVKRRLDLQYPDIHRLVIADGPTEYHITLIIPV